MSRCPPILPLLIITACGADADDVARTNACRGAECGGRDETAAAGCDGESGVELIAEFASDTPFAAGVVATRLNGRAFLSLARNWAADPPTESIFLDVESLTESVLAHDPGFSSCQGTPPWCTVAKATGETELLALDMDAEARVWSAESVLTVYDYPYVFPTDVDVEAGRVVASDGGSVALFEAESNRPRFEFPLPDEHRVGLPIRALEGRVEGVGTRTVGPVPLELGFVEVADGASWSRLYQDEQAPPADFATLFRRGQQWYAARDEGLSDSEVSVHRIREDGAELLGSLDGSLLNNTAAIDDMMQPSSEPVIRAVRCTDDECALHRVDLDHFDVRVVGSVPSPEPRPPWIVGVQFEDCGAVSVTVQSRSATDDGSEANRVYSIRIVPRG